MRSLLRGMMAVWREIQGMGMCLKSADTANQSASAPTMPASVIARRQRSASCQRSDCAKGWPRLQLASTNNMATANSSSSGVRLARRSRFCCSSVRSIGMGPL
ncbi:hypothetical protein D3C72_1907570 [compost metagenome]